jgi:hypothetical protein
MVDVGDDQVLVLLRQCGTPKGGRARVELHYGTVYSSGKDSSTRARVYATAAEAIEAAGLSG